MTSRTTQSRDRRRTAIDRYLDAVDAVGDYNDREVVRWKAGLDEDTAEGQRLNTELVNASAAAPRWARMVWR